MGAPGVSARGDGYWEYACVSQGLCWRNGVWHPYGKVIFMYRPLRTIVNRGNIITLAVSDGMSFDLVVRGSHS
jgi:hypothetical protein